MTELTMTKDIPPIIVGGQQQKNKQTTAETTKGVDLMQGYTYEQTIELPNCTAKIYRPELTAEERNRRMQKIKNASAKLVGDFK